MSDLMTFPKTVDEFMEAYKIVDTEEIYTNGTELVPIFRMKQWFQAHDAIPVAWLENFMNKLPRDNSTDGMSWTSLERWGIKMAISEWEKENEHNKANTLQTD